MGKTILAIDDEKIMLQFYAVVLAEFGAVRTATNLQEARQQLAGVDLILLDFYLEPGQSRFQSVMPEFKKIAPVLLCSSAQGLEVPVIGSASGAAGFWDKTTGREKLCALVKRLLATNETAAQS